MKTNLIQTCLLTVLLALPIVAQAQFNYTTNNGTITITGYTGSGGAVNIPATINGLPVTSIGEYAFYETALTSVTIPNSVTSIGYSAFFACTSLTKLIIPNSVFFIEENAFEGCTALTSVTFPNGIDSIGEYAFSDTGLTNVTIPNSVYVSDWAFSHCLSLTAITVAAQNPNYSSVDGVLFDKNQTTLLQYPIGKGGSSYTISNGVTSIGNGAFYFCKLTSVTIPTSVTSIGDGAFASSGLTSVTIPDGVTSIGDGAFAYVALTNVTIPDNVTSIGAYTFNNTALVNVTIPDSVISMGYGVFYECYSLTNVVIGSNITSFLDYTFDNTALTSVMIPGNVTNIVSDAFLDCSNLTAIIAAAQNLAYSSVNGVLFDKSHNTLILYPPGRGGSYTMPGSVTNIGDDAFYACSSLTSVTIPDNVTSIGERAFGGCEDLTSVFFAGNSPSTDTSAFSWLPGGDSWYPHLVYDPATVYYLSGTTGWSNNFAGLPTVMLNAPPQFGATDDGLEYISYDTKIIITKYVGSDDTVIIPEAIYGLPVTGIGPYAFEYSGLTNVIIPDSVTSIGNSAFSDTALTSVTIPNSVTSIGDDAFEFCSSLTNVTIGNGVTSIGDEAFYDCESLTTVTIGNSVTSIGYEAFVACYSLTSVYFSGNAPTADSTVFDTGEVYYFPGTLGWDDFSANIGLPTALWFLPNPLILNKGPGFGVQTNRFGFTISWATNVPVLVEASMNLSNPVWLPVSTNTLVNGSSYFSDPQPANLPDRFYRLRSP